MYILKDIIEIQPMTLPSGSLFYFEYTYGSMPKNFVDCNGPQIFHKFNPEKEVEETWERYVRYRDTNDTNE